MIELIEIKTDSALYNYAEQLMTTSFPQEERRDTEQNDGIRIIRHCSITAL